MSITAFFILAGSIFGVIFGPLAVSCAISSIAEQLRKRRSRKSLAIIPSRKRMKEVTAGATRCREWQEAYWAEVCDYFGVDFHRCSIERDWCAEIVYQGKSLEEIERRMNKQDNLYLS